MDELTRLLERARAGDADAMASFVRRTEHHVWRFCASLVGPADADDAAQDAYVGLWRGLHAWRGEASATTWLFLIARRAAERVAQRRLRWSELSESTPAPASPAGPGAALEIDATLRCLDVDRRTAFVLTQLIGLSYEEAAAVCECPIGTIRSRVARAREDLIAQQAADLRAEAG